MAVSDSQRVRERSTSWRSQPYRYEQAQSAPISLTVDFSLEITDPSAQVIYGLLERGRRRCLDFYDPRTPSLFKNRRGGGGAERWTPPGFRSRHGSWRGRQVGSPYRGTLTFDSAHSSSGGGTGVPGQGIQSLFRKLRCSEVVHDGRDETEPCYAPSC